MKEVAKVIENTGNKARVKIVRQSACSKCEKDCMLAGDSHEMKEVEEVVNNPVAAEAGQTVKLEMGERPLVYASVIVYLLPLLNLILGYFIGSWFATTFGYKLIEIAGITGAFIFFLASSGMIRLIDSRLGLMKVFHPRITKIID